MWIIVVSPSLLIKKTQIHTTLISIILWQTFWTVHWSAQQLIIRTMFTRQVFLSLCQYYTRKLMVTDIRNGDRLYIGSRHLYMSDWFGMGPQILKKVLQLHCTIESILTGCITAWYRKGTTEGSANGTVHHWGQASCHPGPLYQVVSEEGRKNSSHPSHRLFSLLPHGKRYRSAKSRSKRLLNSFYPQAIRLLNI